MWRKLVNGNGEFLTTKEQAMYEDMSEVCFWLIKGTLKSFKKKALYPTIIKKNISLRAHENAYKVYSDILLPAW